MLSVKRDTVDSFCSLSESRGRRSSIHPNAVLVLPFRNESRWSNPNATALRPPPLASTASTAPPLQSKGLHLRLRSDSGLSLHTNQSAFRQYTDYNSDGSWGSRYSPTRSHSLTKSCSTDNFRLVSKPFSNSASKDIIAPPKTLPDFFDPAIIKLAFSNPATGQRLCQFARTRNSGADMEFLLKVDEYTRVFLNMKSLISQISADFTSVTATSPLDLPVDICNNMKTCAKHCAKQAMPALEKLYRDAKTNVEERLAQTLYPQYVKHQLCQCMRSSLSISRSLNGGFKYAYPGLGNAFCLSDPLEPDNPIVAASDGFLNMSGFERNEVIQKNCRFLQGMSTNPVAARRLSEAVSAGRETTELLINHRKDGTPFWNLLFICPLLENGSIRYFFGAQINVSESMGSDYKDILRILNFGLPEEGLPSKDPKTQRPQEVPAWRAAPAPETESVASAHGSHGTMYRHRFFRRFSRKSPRPAVTTPNVSSAPAGEVPRAAKRRAYTARSPQQYDSSTDEFSTPYSRFFVLRYIPPIVGSHINADKRHYQPRMSVAFCSSFALSLLGLKSHEAEQIQGRDIFSVLSSGSINSASGNRASLRSAVGEKMMAGQSFSVDLVTSAEVLSHTTRAVRGQQQQQQQQPSLKHARNGSVIRSPGASSSEDEGAPRNHNQHSRLSDTLDRGAEILSHVFFGPKMKKLVSHWTPLKNGEGLVEWVVLILTPATA
ncbi:hypothetical protein QBC42DRAFT_217879 [Cladorrhinum samala]|uniref:LOV domain-containing protein n=1 Tax=Cladorrhinum samala TaxID=585594 RepID=A0AAV9I4H5_9PEZI|nr:hypothetical protein QBC42DRAFT_217879 [Cladorrhinum samala]